MIKKASPSRIRYIMLLDVCIMRHPHCTSLKINAGLQILPCGNISLLFPRRAEKETSVGMHLSHYRNGTMATYFTRVRALINAYVWHRVTTCSPTETHVCSQLGTAVGRKSRLRGVSIFDCHYVRFVMS